MNVEQRINMTLRSKDDRGMDAKEPHTKASSDGPGGIESRRKRTSCCLIFGHGRFKQFMSKASANCVAFNLKWQSNFHQEACLRVPIFTMGCLLRLD
mmetsp:Transcript_25369/g.38468  ORF Transcript_25369/g.38468 Transcript_25369/m.38468 type:complete len:97 (-) Transcript_25369:33-323(-)